MRSEVELVMNFTTVVNAAQSHLRWYQGVLFENPVNIVPCEGKSVLVKVGSGLLDPALPFRRVRSPQLFTGAPIIFRAHFENILLFNQTPRAWVQPIVAHSCNHNPTMCKSSNGAKKNIAHFSG